MPNFSYVALAMYNQSAYSFTWIEYKEKFWIWYGITVTTSVIAAISSALLILTILSSSRLRTGSGIFIINLLFIVLFQCLFIIPVFNYRNENLLVCKGAVFFYYWLHNVADWADFVLALNRFVAVCFPHIYPKMVQIKAVSLLLVISWLFPLCLVLFCIPVAGGTMAGTELFHHGTDAVP